MSFRWHRIGVTVKGDSITLILDCVNQVTRKFDRSADSKISTNGLILSGRQLNEDEDFFIGDIQLLSIADSPDEAYHICTKYAPDCSHAQTTRFSTSHEKYNSGARLTSSRLSSSRTTSTRGSNKKKKQNFNSVQDVHSSSEVVGRSKVTNQNEPMVQMNATSRSSQIKISSQSNQTESISTPKSLKTKGGGFSKFEPDGTPYNDDYFDSIDESFYDEGDLLRASENLTNERTGKTFRFSLQH